MISKKYVNFKHRAALAKKSVAFFWKNTLHTHIDAFFVPGGVALLQITRITIKSHHLHLITDSFSILHVFRSVRLLLHVFTTNSHNFTQIYEDSPIVRKIPQVYEKSEGIAHFYEKSERFPCFTLIVYKKF